MKIFLDDERPAPEGFLLVRWPDEVIQLLEHGQVTHLSLDHDLGDDERGTGYDVLLWLEEKVITEGFKPPERITIHSANASAWTKMSQAIDSIHKNAKGR